VTTPALTKSLIGEMDFAVRAMKKRKKRDLVKLISAGNADEAEKVAARVERLTMCQEWLHDQEKSHD
jgi:hypothetical protein